MRITTLALLAGMLSLPSAVAADLRDFDDAALHAVQFLDAEQGWAVGDDGTAWQTMDGGRNWARRPTGVRASLRSVHFLDPLTGWVAGREELPHGGSVGVLLYTDDAGAHWQRRAVNTLPGINRIQFVNTSSGFAIGDGSDQHPGGVFTTVDGGRTWQPVVGPRVGTWLAADLADGQTGVLAGAWGKLGVLRQGTLGPADIDPLGGRAVHDVRLTDKGAVAVGQGGLVLLSADNAGGSWGYAPPQLEAVAAGCDFHGVACRGNHIWIAGRPGSFVLHSGDRGQTWQSRYTGQTLPLNSIFFADEQRGWAVGAFGTILATSDGGRTWAVQRRGGQRTAVLFIHARPAGLPAETVARLGGDEGYLVACLRVLAADPVSADAGQAAGPLRFAAAVRRLGGAAGETCWAFPIPQHLARGTPEEMVRTWDRQHDGQAADRLLSELVLAVRTWQPHVIVTDAVNPQPDGDTLIAEAVRLAVVRAADANAFPKQIRSLGLTPWKVAKTYGLSPSRTEGEAVVDAAVFSPRLEETARDFALPTVCLLAEAAPTLPAQRYFRLLDGNAAGRGLMQGVPISPTGVDRRARSPLAEPDVETQKALRAVRNFHALAEAPPDALASSERLLALVKPTLAALPDDAAARAAFRVGSHLARAGRWELACEVYQQMLERSPTHPLAADACRWLIRYYTSSEARRRQEVARTWTESRVSVQPSRATGLPDRVSGVSSGADVLHERQTTLFAGPDQARKSVVRGQELGTRLAALGPVFADDPAVQFCLQAARRQLGDVAATQKWYGQCRGKHPGNDPWGTAAAAELWLLNRTGLPPRPIYQGRPAAERPYLDGKLDDACWQGIPPLLLANASGDTAKEYATEAWITYDKDFLYLALRCRHPAGQAVLPVKNRTPDADLRPYDRVSVLLDLDRDYATCFQLQIDQRGCVCEDCWGDRSWNPRWFVAVHTTADAWQIEAAIPMHELTGEAVSAGQAWAWNVVRVLPGRGVQAWSLPADVQPRPEGMGLLLFAPEAKR